MKRIKLTQGYEALVDDEDYEWLSRYKWHVSKGINSSTIYSRSWINGKDIYMHRLILSELGKPELQIDHINGNGLDNRRCNLRLATGIQNRRNSRKKISYKRVPASSKYKGVTLYKCTKRWMASGTSNHKSVYIGYYKTEKEAARAYNIFAKEHYGKFARLNVLEAE